MSESRYVRIGDLCVRLGCAPSTIYRLINSGILPKAIALGPRSVVWDLVEVDAAMARRREAQGGALAASE